ncbi:MAG: hypothetical protein V4558_14785 [Gemmatimonadota bacterium]
MAGFLIYTNRWQIGRGAVAIADPAVRRWATKEVRRLSEGAYQLSASTIRVDVERRRIGIDTIIVITDPVANGRRKAPLPSVTLRFRNCSLEGIDLDRLTAGRGLQISKVGCDTVALVAEVPRPGPKGASKGPNDSSAFLVLQKNIDLPREVPYVRIDTLTFPQVRLAIGISGRSGRRTAVAFDRLAVRLDSLHYDPKEPAARRSTLFSRDATVTLDGFEGSRESATRLGVRHLAANLSHGTVQLDGLIYEPLPGGLSDSLGFSALSVGHLALREVDWRAFATEGDVSVGRMSLDSGSITVPVGGPAKSEVGFSRKPRTVEATLRALDRAIRLDTFAVTALSVIERGSSPGDAATTSIRSLSLAHVRFDNDSATWSNALPVGPVTMDARGIARRTATSEISLARLDVDLPAGKLNAEGLHVAPLGNDAAFLRRNRYRISRTALDVAGVSVLGAKVTEYLHDGSYQIRRADVRGFALDILSDKGKPSAPGKSHHATPQGALRSLGLHLHADTVVVAGRVQYRERDAKAPRPGVLTFEGVRATLLNVSTDSVRMTERTPLIVRADARLMGAGALHFEAEVPLLASDFRMKWRGSVGAMDATAMNGLIVDATGVRFIRGQITSVRFDATVTNGVARGSVAPRWQGLGVEVPGFAREQTNLFGKLKRAVAKFAANAFVIRDDNPDKEKPPLDGTINHNWSAEETLPQFLWFALRDALLPLLKL